MLALLVLLVALGRTQRQCYLSKGENAEVGCPSRYVPAGLKGIYTVVATFDLAPLDLQIAALPQSL
jgi:hypothetical protein